MCQYCEHHRKRHRKKHDEPYQELVNTEGRSFRQICKLKATDNRSNSKQEKVSECDANSSELKNGDQSANDHDNLRSGDDNLSSGKKQVCMITTLPENLPRFGPYYGSDESLIVKAKQNTWKHISQKHNGQGSNNGASNERGGYDEGSAIEKYSSVLRGIMTEAKYTYADGLGKNERDFGWMLPNQGSGEQAPSNDTYFRRMMIADGCFFLQSVLSILGVSDEELGYPKGDLLFGSTQKKENMENELKAVFFVGNQIPLLVLSELMKQDFFQGVINRKKKWNKPKELSKRVLYELLVLPHLEAASGQRRRFCLPQIQQKHIEDPEQNRLSDILHGLQNRVLGPRKILEPTEISGNIWNSIVKLFRRGHDDDEEIDLEANANESSAFDDTISVGSARALRAKGIAFKKLGKDKGSRGICFEARYTMARLYLPTLRVDDDTELILQTLRDYEMSQPLSENKREVCAYLRFMSSIIRTSEDVQLLVNEGIIEAASLRHQAKLLRILSDLDCRGETHHLQLVKLQISNFSSMKRVLDIVAFLTFVQTVYAILSYHYSYRNRR